jgi:hypothetical protein
LAAATGARIIARMTTDRARGHLVRSLFAVLPLIAGCGSPRPHPLATSHAAGGEAIAEPASAAPVASSSSPSVASNAPSPADAAMDAALAHATEATRAQPPIPIDRALEEARRIAGNDDRLLDQLARHEAALSIEAGDLARAVQIVQARIDAAAAEHALREFGLHDAMIFLREAQEDPLGAYLEAEAMRSVADMPSVAPEVRARLRLGYTWQRAHTLVHLTEGDEAHDPRRAFVYAREAREQFARLAHEQNRSLASIDVLEEDFATVAHDTRRALEAAGRLAIDDLDPQDLYITLRAYLAAGDEAGIARVRARLDANHDVDLLTSVYRFLSRRALAHRASSAPPADAHSPRSRGAH